MNPKISRIIITAVGIIVLSTNTTIAVLADDVSPSEIITVTENKKSVDVLYVIEKDVYMEILKKDTAIIESKRNLLIVDSKKLTEEDYNKIESANVFYIFGKLEETNKLTTLSNYGEQLYSKNKYKVSLKLANENTDKNIIIVNGESIADYFMALQLGNVEDRNVILINDVIDKATKKYLKNYGKEKSIMFLEGEMKFTKAMKENIMKITGEEKYELDKSQLIKPIKKESDKIVKNLLNISQKKTLPTEENKITDKIKKTSQKTIEKTSKNADELLHNKSKIIAIEDNSELENNIVEILKQDDKLVEILSNENIDNNKKKKTYSLKLTYANPVNIHAQINDDKEEFVVPKETTDEIIKSVMNGDYGNGLVRKELLTQEGYNYEEIQGKVDKLQAEIEKEQESQLSSQRASSYTMKRKSGSVQIPQSSQNTGLDSFINEAFKMKGWEYSQEKRWEYGYADCSSLVIRAMINSGITKNTSNLTTYTIASDNRFYEIPMGQAKRGDILWHDGHMEIYMGGNSTFGAFRPGKLAGFGYNINRFTKAYRIK